MPKPIIFEGGPIFQNSGGMGPDDYLLRPIGSRQWTKVIFRFGRHFGAEIANGKLIEHTIVPNTPESLIAVTNSKLDQMARCYIFPVRQIHVGRNAATERKLLAAGRLIVMSAEEFVRLYGLADDN